MAPLIADAIDQIVEGNDAGTLAASIAVLLVLLFVADHLIERRPLLGCPFWALVDSAVHGLVAVVVTAPAIHRAATTQQKLPLLGLAFLAGTLVHVDHFFVARSHSFWAATHLDKRPPTHSVTFAVLLGATGYVLSDSLSAAWVVFAGLTSHVLRDASVGTAPLLWPLGD